MNYSETVDKDVRLNRIRFIYTPLAASVADDTTTDRQMEIRLILIQTNDQKRFADFYSLLGLTFDFHKHGNSPMHYSAAIGSLVRILFRPDFEINGKTMTKKLFKGKSILLFATQDYNSKSTRKLNLTAAYNYNYCCLTMYWINFWNSIESRRGETYTNVMSNL